MTTGQVIIPVSAATEGDSPLALDFSVPLGAVPSGAQAYYVVMRYGFAMVSGSDDSVSITDSYGAAATNAIEWAPSVVNAHLPGGSVPVQAECNFACIPASPCRARFGTVHLQVDYYIETIIP